jgi:hypothetical protein
VLEEGAECDGLAVVLLAAVLSVLAAYALLPPVGATNLGFPEGSKVRLALFLSCLASNSSSSSEYSFSSSAICKYVNVSFVRMHT